MPANVNVQTNQDATDGENNTEKPKMKSNSADVMYFIEMTINGKKAYAFVDTGDAASSISFYGAVRRGLGDQIDTRHRAMFDGITGTGVTIGVIMQSKLKIEDFSFLWSFRVRSYFNYIIIGTDILRHFKAKMDISKRTLVLHFKEEPTVVPLITLSETIDRNEQVPFTKNPFTMDDLMKKMTNFFHCKTLDKMYESAIQRNPLTLQFGRCSFIKVNLNGHNIPALIDTGCARNVICEKIATHYKFKQSIDYDSKGTGITGSNGKRIPLGMVSQCDIGIGDCSFVETLHVIPTKVSFILGTDFLNRIKAKIDFENNNLEFSSVDRQCRVPLILISNKCIINET